MEAQSRLYRMKTMYWLQCAGRMANIFLSCIAERSREIVVLSGTWCPKSIFSHQKKRLTRNQAGEITSQRNRSKWIGRGRPDGSFRDSKCAGIVQPWNWGSFCSPSSFRWAQMVNSSSPSYSNTRPHVFLSSKPSDKPSHQNFLAVKLGRGKPKKAVPEVHISRKMQWAWIRLL